MKGALGLLVAMSAAAVIAGAVAVNRSHARPPALAAPVAWHEGAAGFAQAVEERQASSGAMLIYFHTEWCGYCKKFERDLWPTAAVQSGLRDVVKVRINPERSPEERAIAERYGVHGFPSLFVERGGAPKPLHPFTRGAGGWVEATPDQFVAEVLQ